MNITYERKHNDSYMIIDGKLDGDSFETKMLQENAINALLDINSFAINGEERLSYKISRKENLEDFVDSTDLTLEVITRIFINLQIALDEISNYLIDESNVLLDKETIFIEKGGDNFKLGLCYYPAQQESVQVRVRELMEFFLTRLSHSDKEKSRRVYMAYDLCLKDDFTISEIIDCLQEGQIQESDIYVEHISLKNEVAEEYLEDEYDLDEIEYMEEDYMEADSISDYCKVPTPRFRVLRKILSGIRGFSNKIKFEDDYEEKAPVDFVIDPDYELEEKTVLLSEAAPIGRLVYDGNSNEDDFLINKDIFRIGTSKNNDAILKARTVSGSHAKITKEGNDFYITDSNSTNGSFLNSLPLAYRKPYKLKPMDVIRFATESYIFM